MWAQLLDGLVGEKGDSTLGPGSWSSPLSLDIAWGAWGATEASLSRLSCLTQTTAELTKGTGRLVPAGCLVPRRLDKSFSPQFDQRLRGFLFIGEKKINCCLTTTSPINLTPPVSLCCFSLLKGTSLPTLPFSMASFPSPVPWLSGSGKMCQSAALLIVSLTWVWPPSWVRRLVFICLWSQLQFTLVEFQNHLLFPQATRSYKSAWGPLGPGESVPSEPMGLHLCPTVWWSPRYYILMWLNPFHNPEKELILVWPSLLSH